MQRQMATNEDVLDAMRTALARIGMTCDELMAKAGGDSDRLPEDERRVWFAFAGMDNFGRELAGED